MHPEPSIKFLPECEPAFHPSFAAECASMAKPDNFGFGTYAFLWSAMLRLADVNFRQIAKELNHKKTIMTTNRAV